MIKKAAFLFITLLSPSLVLGDGPPFSGCATQSPAKCGVTMDQVYSVISSVHQKFQNSEQKKGAYSDTHLVIKGLSNSFNKVITFTMSNASRSGRFQMNEIMNNCFKLAQVVKVDPESFNLVLKVYDKHFFSTGTHEFSSVLPGEKDLTVYFDYHGFDRWKGLIPLSGKSPTPPEFNVQCRLG